MRIGIASSFLSIFTLLLGHFGMIRAFVSQQPVLATIRATRAMASSTSGSEMLQMKTWAVVGDALNEKKPAFQIAQKLRDAGKEVFIVNPREKEGRCFTSLKDCPTKPEVVDLVISPQVGPSIVEDMAELGILNVFVQPGAGTPAILAQASEKGISVHEGCVLIEL